MKYVLTATAVFFLLIAVPDAVSAAGPDRGFQIVNNNYNFNYNYQDDWGHGRRGSPYGPAFGYRGRYGFGGGHIGESHDAAARRIKATHSRFRQHTHPRSLYQSPPSYYDWRGW